MEEFKKVEEEEKDFNAEEERIIEEEEEKKEEELKEILSKLGPIRAKAYRYERNEEGEEVVTSSFASVRLRKKKKEFMVMEVNPVEKVEPFEVPLPKSFLVKLVSWASEDVRRVFYEATERGTVEFSPTVKFYRFFFVERENPDVKYEVRIKKRDHSAYRLMGKLRNVVASLDNWSVVLSGTNPVSLVKRVENTVILEIMTPFYETFLTREEIMSVLAWRRMFEANPKVVGAFKPNDTKKIIFGLIDEEGNVVPGFVIGNTVYSGWQFFRTFMGVLEVASYVV